MDGSLMDGMPFIAPPSYDPRQSLTSPGLRDLHPILFGARAESL